MDVNITPTPKNKLGGALSSPMKKNAYILARRMAMIRSPNGMDDWLVVSTPLKNISQIGNLPQIEMEI